MSYLETELGLLCVLSSRASAGPADDRLGPRCEEIDKTPEQVSEDEYQRVRSWYRRVQGEWAWKRPIVALGHGARVSFISAAGDWPYYHLPSWRHEGLAERDGTPRPAVLNYALIVRELEGASGVERLDLGEDVWAFRVERAEREPLYLLWWDDRLPDLPDEVLPPGRPTSTSVSLDVGAAEVEITYPITELGAVAHETAIIATAGGRLDLELGETPVLVRTSVP